MLWFRQQEEKEEEKEEFRNHFLSPVFVAGATVDADRGIIYL